MKKFFIDDVDLRPSIQIDTSKFENNLEHTEEDHKNVTPC